MAWQALAAVAGEAGIPARPAAPELVAPARGAETESREMPSVPPAGPEVDLPHGGIRVKVRVLRIRGATVFDEATLQAELADAIGHELDFAELQGLAQRLGLYYRSHGFLLARAILPAQKIRDGEIELVVVEGRLGRLGIDASVSSDPERVERESRAYLGELQAGEVLKRQPLERGLLLLGDLPGVSLQSTLVQGQVDGSTDLDLRVRHEPRSVGGSLSLDNHGGRFTGEARLTSRVRVGSPWGFGDSLDLTASTSGIGIRGAHYRFVRSGWQTPVGHAGTQLGVAAALMDYHFGEEFESTDGHGQAAHLSLQAQHSWVRSRSRNVQAQALLDLKRFEDWNTGAQTRRQLQVLTLRLSDRRGFVGGATGQAALALGLGHLGHDGSDDAHGTSGGFGKLGFQGEFVQPLAGSGYSAVLKVQGQWAGKNLDASEKIGLGGPTAVRAFAGSESMSDTAAVLSAELLRSWGGLTGRLFFDLGRGAAFRDPVASDPAENTRGLAGGGFGLEGRPSPRWWLSGHLAWQAWGISSSAVVDRSPRLWAVAMREF
jgi:hemolysin activation/secretion protein